MSSDYLKEVRRKIGNDLLLLPGVAAVLLNSDNELLLQEKQSEAWSLPAGMIEPGESPQEAIIREVNEETGLIVVPQKILGVFGGEDFRYRYPNGDCVEYTIILFRCSVTSDTGDIQDMETKSIKYFDKASMPSLALPYPIELLFDQPGSV